MAKWHINKNGVPAPCRATTGKCPLGGSDSHFENKEDAIRAAQERLSYEFGIIPAPKEKKEPENIPPISTFQRKDIAKMLELNSETGANGFYYECYASVAMAEKLGLEKIAIINKNGEVSSFSLVTQASTDDEHNAPLEESIDTLAEYYKNVGLSIGKKDSLARIVYYSEDPERGVYIQSGGSNVLDAALIKDGEVKEVYEIKELGSGAQVSSKSMPIDENGFPTAKGMVGQMKAITNILKDFNIKDSDGSDTLLDFGSKRKNEIVPLYNFVKQYQKKGATSLLYTSDKMNVVNEVSLKGEIMDVVERLKENKIEAEISVRANGTLRKSHPADMKRLLSDNELFDNPNSERETFKLSEINPSKIGKRGESIRIGGFVIESIKYKDYKENLDKEITINEVKSFNFMLTGKVKSKQTSRDLRMLKEKENK